MKELIALGLINEDTINLVAQNGDLKRLKRLHEEGCPWDSTACKFAIANGQLKCLKYLHQEGCEWESTSCWLAARYGHLDCLKYLHENGCPWNWEVYKVATSNDCRDYLNRKGCPKYYGQDQIIAFNILFLGIMLSSLLIWLGIHFDINV